MYSCGQYSWIYRWYRRSTGGVPEVQLEILVRAVQLDVLVREMQVDRRCSLTYW